MSTIQTFSNHLNTLFDIEDEDTLTEAKGDSYRLVILVDRSADDKGGTSGKLYSTAKKLGISAYNCRINGAYVQRDPDTQKITLHEEGDDKGFELNQDTVVFIRGDVTSRESYMNLITQIERYGISCNNSRDTIKTCCDKFRSYLTLQEVGLNQPRTVLIPNDEKETVKRAHEQLDSKFPMVMKTLSGSQGVGVLLIETERSLQSQVSLLYKIDPNTDLLLQEYIEQDYDVRCVIVNNKIIGAMKRNKIIDDFRSNATQGAEVELIKLTKLEEQECIKAAKAVNGQWVGVDFMPGKDRKKNKPYILEVNHSPGTKGISEATNKDIVKEVLELYYDKDIWRTSATECGVLETFTVDGQKMTGKLDTGNSTSVCSLHADNIKVDGKDVVWTMMGQEHRRPLYRKVTLKKPAETRPVILMDIEFLNTKYQVEVSLDKRVQIPFLINREFMQRANIMINPARKFLLTDKVEY